jgi:toxin YoeB
LEEPPGDTPPDFHPRNATVDPQGTEGAAQQVLHYFGLVSWVLHFTKQAQKDAKKVASSNLRPNAERLLEILKENPFQNPPPFEKLMGDLDGAYSRRINIHNRLVYQVFKEAGAVKIVRMWTHFE